MLYDHARAVWAFIVSDHSWRLTKGFKMILRCVAKRHDYMFRCAVELVVP